MGNKLILNHEELKDLIGLSYDINNRQVSNKINRRTARHIIKHAKLITAVTKFWLNKSIQYRDCRNCFLMPICQEISIVSSAIAANKIITL